LWNSVGPQPSFGFLNEGSFKGAIWDKIIEMVGHNRFKHYFIIAKFRNISSNIKIA